MRSSDLSLRTYLSPERLEPFVRVAGGDLTEAIRFYRWNIELSGAVYEALHVVEVMLRNAMDRQLSRWNATQRDRDGLPCSENWLNDPCRLLSRLVRKEDRAAAHKRATMSIGGRPVSHGDLLTQMSFATWRYLLPERDPGRRLLWKQCLHRAFPQFRVAFAGRSPRSGATANPTDLTYAVAGLHLLRNRVAHLEPIHDVVSVRLQLGHMRQVLYAIDPGVHEWFIGQQRVSDVLERHPSSGNDHQRP